MKTSHDSKPAEAVGVVRTGETAKAKAEAVPLFQDPDAEQKKTPLRGTTPGQAKEPEKGKGGGAGPGLTVLVGLLLLVVMGMSGWAQYTTNPPGSVALTNSGYNTNPPGAVTVAGENNTTNRAEGATLGQDRMGENHVLVRSNGVVTYPANFWSANASNIQASVLADTNFVASIIAGGGGNAGAAWATNIAWSSGVGDNTNVVVITGCPTNGVDGTYTWNGDYGYTNSSPCVIVLDTGIFGAWLITNDVHHDIVGYDVVCISTNSPAPLVAPSGWWDVNATLCGPMLSVHPQIPLTNFIPSDLTWPGTASNAIYADLSYTATNVTPESLTNDMYYAWLRTTQNDKSNYWRFGWTHTLSKLKKRQQVRIAFWGSGLSGPILDGLITLANKHLNTAGFGTWLYNSGLNQYVQHVTSGSATGGSKDNIFLAQYYYTWANDGIVRAVSKHFGCNRFELSYLTVPAGKGGGTFKVQTNVPGSETSFVDAVTGLVSTNSGTSTQMVVLRFDIPAVSANVTGCLQVVHTSGSSTTNWVINVGIWSTNVTDGVIWGSWGAGGIGDGWPQFFNSAATNVLRSWMTNTQPDLILWNHAASTAASTNAGCTNWWSFVRGALPSADIVQCATYPLSLDADRSQEDMDVAKQGWMDYIHARLWGHSYYDARNTLGPHSEWYRRGNLSDQVHATTTGYVRYQRALWEWLALDWNGLYGP